MKTSFSTSCCDRISSDLCPTCRLTNVPFFCSAADAPSTEQQKLFTQKLQQCCMLFDFLDSVTDLKSKEIKRATLNELVDYVSNRGVLVEAAYPEISNMVRMKGFGTVCSQPSRKSKTEL